jgi:hypothetical protein
VSIGGSDAAVIDETVPEMSEADRLRESAARLDREAHDSFERCDTDGYLSQWAAGLGAQKLRLQADIEDNGGVWQFPALFDLDGNPVRAKLVEGRFGRSWMLLDENGRSTGEFLRYRPKKRDTHARKGYVEGSVLRPAKADLRGDNAISVRAVAVPTDRDTDPPAAIISTDRWTSEDG